MKLVASKSLGGLTTSSLLNLEGFVSSYVLQLFSLMDLLLAKFGEFLPIWDFLFIVISFVNGVIVGFLYCFSLFLYNCELVN